MVLKLETQWNYDNSFENIVSELSDLSQNIKWKGNADFPPSESVKFKEYNENPYINDNDYAKYFAPETYNFKQFWIWSCWFVTSIYWITQMENYEQLIKNSVKKDVNGNFIIKMPLTTEKNNIWTWHKIDISVYQNQRTINGSNPRILRNDKKDTDSWNGIVALAMAIWEEIVGKSWFDINRLDGWDSSEVFLDWKIIKDISLEETVEYPKIRMDKLKEALWHKNTIIIASVKINENDYSIETVWNDNEPNHGFAITKVIKENNREYVQYYDPNYVWLRKILVDDFMKKCFKYEVFCKTGNKYNYTPRDREKKYYSDDENKNTPGMVVENTGKSNDTLRNLRWDFITYKDKDDDKKIIVESRGKRAEIIDNSRLVDTLANHISIKIVWNKNIKAWEITIWEPYRTIIFSDSNVCLNVDKNKLSNKYNWDKDEQYKTHLYLQKIANFINRMMYSYIDTEARNTKNASPFSLNTFWWLTFDDNPDHINLNNINNSEREKIKKDWEERKEEKQKFWNDKLVCLRDRSKLGIDDKETKESIVKVLNNMVKEKSHHK